MCLKYEIPGFSYSGLKIDKADVKNFESKKIDKESEEFGKKWVF